jgi:PilZ domain-containing protein
VAVELPVDLPGGTGRTRDVSTAGVYIVTDRPPQRADTLRFTLRFDHAAPEAPLWLHCEGRIVRVEPVGAEVGLAVAIHSRRLEAHERPKT